MDNQLHSARTLRVFLSSTSVDLEPYRTRVASLIAGMGQFAVTMNEMPLRPTLDATSLSHLELRASDLYLLLLAWRYGTVPEGGTLSVTHEEYREARRLDMPCFAFLAHETTDADQSPTALFPASVRDPQHRQQLLDFRAEVQGHLVQRFSTLDELVDKVAAALNKYLIEVPLDLPPRDLPPKVPGFVGREEELDKLLTTLRQGQSVGLSALVAGMGGVGKSALAAEALWRLAADASAFPGGIAWESCDERTGVEGLNWVYDQVQSAWGAPLPSGALRGASTPEAEAEIRERRLCERLRPRGAALLLLDNVELDLPLARALATLTPLGITLLVTTRSRFDAPSLRLLALDTLEEQDAIRLLAERFTDRGGAWDAARDEPDARTVVRMLGRLPLAIELAAARAALAQLGIAGLAAELQQPDVLARLQNPLNAQASVRYSFEKSLALLTADQRVRFAALGLPDGPEWPRPVIEQLLAVVPPSSVEQAAATEAARADLDRMVALSLVTLVAPGARGVVRVRVHPLLRELAAAEWEQQPAPVQQAGLEGLLDGVASWAEAHTAQEAQTYALLEEDEALLVGALRRAVAANDALDAVVDTAFALASYLDEGGHWRVGVEVWSLALQAAREELDTANEGPILGNLGSLYHALGEVEQARRYYEQALAIARERGDQGSEADNLSNLGILFQEQGEWEQARRYDELALAIYDALEDRANYARTLSNLGVMAVQQGEWEEAHRHYEQALAIFREVGDQAELGRMLSNLGELATIRGDYEQAHGYLDEALRLAPATGDRDLEAIARLYLADLAREEHRWADAEQLVSEALQIARQLGGRRMEAEALVVAGKLARDQGQSVQAQQLFEQALAIFTALGAKAKLREVRDLLAGSEGGEPPAAVAAAAAPKPKRG
jgi:tetratricopeptide (TPR) repeat protein